MSQPVVVDTPVPPQESGESVLDGTLILVQATKEARTAHGLARCRYAAAIAAYDRILLADEPVSPDERFAAFTAATVAQQEFLDTFADMVRSATL